MVDVVALERMDNLVMCLHLLTTVAKTERYTPDSDYNLMALR